jgi:ParB family chromosome partitioning protein
VKHYRSTRSFNLIWTELDGLGEMYDVDVLAVEMSDADWRRFDSVVTATIAFRDQLAAARRCAQTPSEATDA